MGLQRQPWLRRKRLWAGVLGSLLLLGTGTGLVVQRRQSSQQRSLSQYTVVARQGSLPGTITASGELMGGLSDMLFGSTGPRGGQRDGVAQLVVKSAVRTVGSAIGREIVRGVLGGLLGGSKRK